MGVTVTVGLLVWIAGSLVEYKIITNIPALKGLFHNPLAGVIISLAIGAAVGFVLGAPTGAGVMLGQLLGVATNNFTFNFYTKLDAANRRKHEVTTKVHDFKNQHPATFQQAKDGFRLLFKTIGLIFFAIVWIFGIPSRINNAIQSMKGRLRHA